MKTLSRIFAFALLLAWGTAQATFIVTTGLAPRYQGTVGLAPYASDGAMTYDAGTDLLSLDSTHIGVHFAPLDFPLSRVSLLDLAMNLSSSGESSGGTFSLFGALSGSGSNALLLQGAIVGTNLCGGPGCSPLSFDRSNFIFYMQTTYVDPSVAWDPYFVFSCLTCGQAHGSTGPVTGSNLFTNNWSASAADYYDLLPIAALPFGTPEPTSIALLVVGLAAVAIGRRRTRGVVAGPARA